MLLVHTKLQGSPLAWSDAAPEAFAETKKALAEAAILEYPEHDAPTSLMVDASGVAVGAVL